MQIYKLADSIYSRELVGWNAFRKADRERVKELSNLTMFGRALPSPWKPFTVKAYWEDAPGKPLANVVTLDWGELLSFDQKSVNALSGILAKDGHLCPLNSDDGQFYIFAVNTPIDALDFEKSFGSWEEEPIEDFVSEVYIYSFKPEMLHGIDIFKVPQLTGGHYYVSETFKNRFQAAGLTGQNFLLVWDSDDPNYWNQRYKLDQWKKIKEKYVSNRRT